MAKTTPKKTEYNKKYYKENKVELKETAKQNYRKGKK